MKRTLIVCAAIGACHVTPAPAPVPGDLCATVECACAHLCEIGCVCDDACVDVMNRVIDDRVMYVDLVCTVLASDAASAENCEGIECE